MSRRLRTLGLTAILLLLGHSAVTRAQTGDGPAPAAVPGPWLASGPVAAGPTGPGDIPEPGYVENQLLVKFKPGTSDEAKAALHARYGAQVISEIPALGIQVLRLVDATTVAVTAYQANSEVQFAEPNYLAEILGHPDPVQPALAQGAEPLTTSVNDPYFAQQWHHAKIRTPDGWDFGRGQGVVIAIVDTGVTCTHPDLVGKCVAGYDFVNSDNDPRDDHGHGTHVAGIAAMATNNGIGGAGVGFDAKVMPMKALSSSGNGGHAAIASAITWATDHGAHVINMSLGGYFTSSTLRNAVAYAISHGVSVVSAAGNDNTSNPTYPAAYPDVIGVAATTQSDGRASFSNYGTFVDVAAPGVGILSSVMSGSYQAWSGTSMASPVAAGLAALLKGQNMARTPLQIEQIMEANADDLGAAGWDQLFGYGRINAFRAMSASGAPTSTPATPQPTRTPAPPTATRNVQVGDCAGVERLINDERTGFSLPPLFTNDSLRSAAQTHAQDMADNRFCDHTGSDGSSPYDRMRRVNYNQGYGEIVACGQTSAQAAVEAWMNSEGHRAIILCSSCTELGAGCSTANNGYRYYWVVNFGSRAVSGPTATARPTSTRTPPSTATVTPVPATPEPGPTNLPGSTTVPLSPANNRIGWVASNEPNVNHFDDTDTFTGVNSGLVYHGAMQFDLAAIPAGAYVNWARLEMTGRSRAYLGDSGTWTVNILTSDNDPGFPQFGYSRVHAAYIEATLLPMLGLDDLGVNRTNVFNFQGAQVSTIATRLASTGRITFRMDGPTTGGGLNLFTWDSGYGSSTTYPGPKLIINYSLVPPTPEPTATATEPPPPTVAPTDGPTATATPTEPPPTPTDTAPPPPPSRTPTATIVPEIPTHEPYPILEIRPACGTDASVGWVRQTEIDNHWGDDNMFTGFYQGMIYHGGAQFDLSGIPPLSRIIAARLLLTGQSTRYLSSAGNGLWRPKILAPAIDGSWRTAGYSQIHGAKELSGLVPQLSQANLGVGVRNTFVFTAEQLGMLEERVATTRLISLRLDGPSAGNSNIMDWDTGCGPGVREGPVLQVQFGAIVPGEPTATDQPESRSKGLAMIDAINAERRKAGLTTLALSEELMTAARVHNMDISSKDLFSHVGSDGSQPADRVRRAGFLADVVGEVLAMGSSDVPSVLSVWLSKDAQKQQFMRADLTHIGAHWTQAPRASIHNYWTVVTAREKQ